MVKPMPVPPEKPEQEPGPLAAPPAAEPAGERRSPLGWVLRVLISFSLLAWLLSKESTREALGGVSPTTFLGILGGVALYVACQMLNTYKWSIILRAMGYAVPFRELARTYFVGMFSNFFLPTSIGGDVVRVGLMRRYGVPLTTGTLSVFVQRYTGLVAMLGIGLVGVVSAHATTDQAPRAVLVGMALLLGGSFVAMVVATWADQRWRLTARLPNAVARPLARLSDGSARLARAPRALLAVMLLSVVFQLLMVVLNAYLGWVVGLKIALAHWFWVVPVTTLGGMIPGGLGGIGTREFVAEEFLKLLGQGGLAVIWSLSYQASVILASLPGAVLVAGHKAAARQVMAAARGTAAVVSPADLVGAPAERAPDDDREA